MSTNTQLTTTPPNRLAVAKRVDEIASGAMALFKEAGSFESELSVALAMNDLRMALTDDMMQPVMALMNTDLGFRTDRDPKVTPKDKDGNPVKPYSLEVVRECFIESKLRGFHTVGNEWNIIAGRFYACRNGLKRKCEQWPGVTDLKVNLGVPRMIGEKGAVVSVKATWRKDGVTDSIEADVPVRVNQYMGADAVLGKAERKIYKRIHDRMSGIMTPEGEAGEDIEVQPASTPSARFDAAKPANATAEAPAAPTPEPQPEQPATPSEAEPEKRMGKVQAKLAEMVTAAGCTFEDFKKWAKDGAMPPHEVQSINGFEDVPDKRARIFVNSPDGLIAGIRRVKGGK